MIVADSLPVLPAVYVTIAINLEPTDWREALSFVLVLPL